MQTLKKKTTSFIITFILTLWCWDDCYSQKTLFRGNTYTFYYGGAYRFDNTYRHVISVDKWKRIRSCVSCGYRVIGVSAELTDNKNYTLGLNLGTNIFGHGICPFGMLYFAIEPKVFFLHTNWGVNTATELGVHFSRKYKSIGGSLNLLYGYDIRLINKNEYDLSRHQIRIKIGINFERSPNHI